MTKKIEPGVFYPFSEPFRSQLIAINEAMLRREEARRNGTLHTPEPPKQGTPEYHKAKRMSARPPSPAQMKLLKRLGCSLVPMNMWDASNLIEEYKGK